jgi:uncharacterized protein YkwD
MMRGHGRGRPWRSLLRQHWYVAAICLLVLLVGCGKQASQIVSAPLTSDSLYIQQQNSTPTISISIPQQPLSLSPASSSGQSKPATTPAPVPTDIPNSGIGPAPYGPPPPLTTEEAQLTQQLFDLINHDRAVRGLYPFVWNATLAGGARLHSWNMYHCGFSHTCPDGIDQCTRIANEGFTFTDCGECIGLAGPSNPPWANIYAVQESMMNEGPTGWHYIHLTSTTLHRIGVGLYIDPTGWVWFTEDMIS